MIGQLFTSFADTVCDSNGKRWFFERQYCCVCYMDKGDFQIHMARKLQEDFDIKSFMSFNIYIRNDLLYITSQNSTDILVYDIKNNIFSYYANNLIDECEELYYNSARIGENIILIPQRAEKTSFIFHMGQNVFSRKKWLSAQNKDIIVGSVYNQNDFIYLPVLGENYFYVLNGRTFQYETIELPKSIHLCSIYMDGEEMWFTQADSKVILHNKEGLLEYIEMSSEQGKCNIPFSRLLRIENQLIIFPRNENDIYIYQFLDKKVKKIEIPDLSPEEKASETTLFYGYYQEDKLFFLPWKKPFIYKLDCQTYQIEKHALYTDVQTFCKYVQQVLTEEKGYLEELCSILINE